MSHDPTAHPVERRAKLLAGALQHRVEVVRTILGDRPPFTDRQTRREALAFWRKHRYDEIGQALVQRMKAEDILDLDRALTEEVEPDDMLSPTDTGEVRDGP